MFGFVIVLFSILCSANCLECYYCHQTTNACKEGQVNALKTINCTEGEYCFSFKYATKLPDVTVIAVERGCTYLGNKTCDKKMPEINEGNDTKKGINCKICTTPLCNMASLKLPVYVHYIMFISVFVIFGL